MDWIAFGLPTEGRKVSVPRVTDAMRIDIPTCGLQEPIGDVRERVRASEWEICAVVNDEQVVLGLLHSGAWDADSTTVVEEVMSNGPPTTRPSTFLDEMVERLHQRASPGILTSNSHGVLMGYLWTSDAEISLATRDCTRTWTDRDCSPSEAG